MSQLSPLKIPLKPDKRAFLVPVAALVVVGIVLVHGAFHREETTEAAEVEPESDPVPTISTLRPDLDKTPLAYASDYWLQLGRDAQLKVMLLTSEGIPAVAVGERLAVTSIRAARAHAEDEFASGFEEAEPEAAPAASEEEDTPERQVSARGAGDDGGPPPLLELLGVEPSIGLALFRLGTSFAPVAFSLAPSERLTPGAQIAAVTRTASGHLAIAPGYVVKSRIHSSGRPGDGLSVAINSAEMHAAEAIVDLDGDLVAVALESAGGRRIIPSEALSKVVHELRGESVCRAVEVAELTDDAATLLGVSNGVLIERVIAEGFDPEPSLRAGDILVRWRGEAVDSVETFNRLYDEAEAGSLVRYTVLREGNRVSGGTLVPGPDCRPAQDPLLTLRRLGAALRWSKRGSQEDGRWTVARLAEDGLGESSGLLVGDEVVSFNGRSGGRIQIRRWLQKLEDNPRSFVLGVGRGGRVKLVTVQFPSE